MPLDKKQERTLSKLWNNGRETAISQNTHDLDNSSFQLVLVNNECIGQAAHFATIMTQLYQLDNFERLEQATTDSNNLSDFSDLNVEAQWWQVPDFAESLLEMIPLAMGGSIYYSEYDPLNPPCPAIALGTCADVVSSDPCVAAMVADPNSGITLNTPWLIVNIMKWQDVDTDIDAPAGPIIDGCCDGGILIIDPPSGGWPGDGTGLPPGILPPNKNGGGNPIGNAPIGGSSPENISLVCSDHIVEIFDGPNSTVSFPDAIDAGSDYLNFLLRFSLASLIPIIPVLDIAQSDLKTAIDTAITAASASIPAHSKVIEVELGYAFVCAWDYALDVPLPVGSATFHVKRDRIPPSLTVFRGTETTSTERYYLKPDEIINLGAGKTRVADVPLSYSMQAGVATQWQHELIPQYDKVTSIALNTQMFPAIDLDQVLGSSGGTANPNLALALCGVKVEYTFVGYWLAGQENSFTSNSDYFHVNFDFQAAFYSGDRWPTVTSGAIESDVDEVLLEIVADPATFSIDGDGNGPMIYMNTTGESQANVIAWSQAGGGTSQKVMAPDTTSKHRWWIKVPTSPRDEIWYRSSFGRNFSLRMVGVHQVSTGKRFVEADNVTYASKPVIVH